MLALLGVDPLVVVRLDDVGELGVPEIVGRSSGDGERSWGDHGRWWGDGGRSWEVVGGGVRDAPVAIGIHPGEDLANVREGDGQGEVLDSVDDLLLRESSGNAIIRDSSRSHQGVIGGS